ncbi:MAG TPA: DbpA RNA binding domain-containing protein, partial [Steroidobacteraceae bacterium]|nr:DbpA RNA binding domain-containing protein [Steroidobacteraceae bacterium]
IANVLGLDGSQINGIDIQRRHSFVRLPADLAPEALKQLREIRVRGQLLASVPAEPGRDTGSGPEPRARPSARPYTKPFKDRKGPKTAKGARKPKRAGPAAPKR